MKTFSKFLMEHSFSRVHTHTKNRNIGLISASRGDMTAEENNKRTASLASDLSKEGHGFIKVRGVTIENFGKPDARKVTEHSFLVVGDKKHGGLLKSLKRLGAKYGQDSILHKPHDDENASLHGTNETGHPGKDNVESVGKWHPNRAGEFHTLMKGKPFAFAESYKFYYEKPVSFFSRIKNALYD